MALRLCVSGNYYRPNKVNYAFLDDMETGTELVVICKGKFRRDDQAAKGEVCAAIAGGR